jgi:hypothetical protein
MEGFRYFNLEPDIAADPVWTSEVVSALMGTLSPIPETDEPHEPVKVTMIVHKPQPKTTLS